MTEKKTSIYDFIMKSELTSAQIKLVLFLNKNLRLKNNFTTNELISEINVGIGCVLDAIKGLGADNLYGFDEIFFSGGSIDEIGKATLNIYFLGTTVSILNDCNKIGRRLMVKKSDSAEAQAKELFTIWQKLISPRSKYNDKHKVIIVDRVEKFGFENCKMAVVGCSKSLFHMGYDPFNGEILPKKYNKLANIFAKNTIYKLGLRFNDGSLEDQLDELKKNKKGPRDFTEEIKANFEGFEL
jgi:hypothetical protein